MSRIPWVLVAAGFHSNGGMDKANLALAQYLTSEGIPVHLVTHSADSSATANSLVTLHTVSRPLNSLALGEPLLNFQGRLIAKKVLSKFPNAKVVVNGGNCILPAVNWSHYVHHAWQPEVKEKDTFRGAAKGFVHRWDKSRERVAYQMATLVIANSDVTRRHLLQHFSLDPERVKTLYLGANPAWGTVTQSERETARAIFQIPQSRHCAVFIGAVGNDRRKGTDVLLSAWKQLCADENWDVDLFVAGDGRNLPQCRAAVASWNLEHRIRLLGFRCDVPHLLAASDLLVSPTRYEPYGLNVQEAICRGIPALASAASGIAERYPQNLKTFLLPDAENVSDLVARLRIWRSNVSLWKSQFQPFGIALRSNTWQDMARSFVSLVIDSQATDASKQTEMSHCQ